MDEIQKEMEDYFCRFTFGQFVTLILLELVTLFFVFYLGAHYGPELIGNRADVAKKEDPLSLKGGTKSVDEIVGSPSLEYTYPEVLTDTGKPQAIRIKPSGLTAAEYEKGGENAKEVPVEVREPEPIKLDSVPVAEPVEGLSGPVAAKKPSSGRYAIQVGSFPSSEEASLAIAKWKGRGYSAFMAVGEIPDKGTWYRVRIGGFKTREEAQGFLQKFKQKEKAVGLVVLSKS